MLSVAEESQLEPSADCSWLEPLRREGGGHIRVNLLFSVNGSVPPPPPEDSSLFLKWCET